MVSLRRARSAPLAQIFTLLIAFIIVSASFVYAQTTSSSTVYSSSSSQPITSSVVESNHAGGGCPFSVLEGNLLHLNAEGFDPDPEIGPAGELLWTYAYPVAPYGLWQTRIGDAGRYYTAIRLSDGELADTVSFCIDVLPQPLGASHTTINHAPKLFGVDDITVHEGDDVMFRPACIDPDGDDVSISIIGPLTVPLYHSVRGDAGDYSMTLTCTDSRGLSSTEIQHVVVLPLNRAPIISVENVTVYEGDLIALRPSVYDPDGDFVTVSVSEPFSPEGVWQTGAGDAGLYSVFVYASDGKSLSQKLVSVSVLPWARAPQVVQESVPAPQAPIVIEVRPETQQFVQPVSPCKAQDVIQIVYPGEQQPQPVVCPYAQAPSQVVEVRDQAAPVCPYVCPYAQPVQTQVVEVRGQQTPQVVCPYVQPSQVTVVEVKSQASQQQVVCPYTQPQTNVVIVKDQPAQQVVCPYAQPVQTQIVEVKNQPAQQQVVCPYVQPVQQNQVVVQQNPNVVTNVNVQVVCPLQQQQVVQVVSQPAPPVQTPVQVPVQTAVIKCPFAGNVQPSDDVQVVNSSSSAGDAPGDIGCEKLKHLTPQERINRWKMQL
jgi:hypothetical protein